MLRLYQPCLPTRAPKAPTGPLWVHEIKHDGFRLIARRVGGDVRLFTKTGFDVSGRYTLVADALRRLNVRSVVLDGEVCCNTFDDCGAASTITPRTCSRSICWRLMALTIGRAR